MDLCIYSPKAHNLRYAGCALNIGMRKVALNGIFAHVASRRLICQYLQQFNPPPPNHMSTEKWPRLTVQIQGERHPGKCQRCAQEWDLQIWQECDDCDQPEKKFIVLCDGCSEILIESHPRLYLEWPTNKPFPGLMAELCSDCASRDGLCCMSPLLIVNGGSGMKITAHDRGAMHWHGTDQQGEPTGGIWENWGPSQGCAGKDITKAATNIIRFTTTQPATA